MSHPIQPLEKDKDGVIRFKQNNIVRYLLDNGPFDMNQISILPFTQEDREQFAQLIGYSLFGFRELSYVSDETCETANILANNPTISEEKAKINLLSSKLELVKRHLRPIVTELFNIHPDDLK